MLIAMTCRQHASRLALLPQAKDEILRLRRVNRQQTEQNEFLEMRLSSSSSMPSDSTSFARYRARNSSPWINSFTHDTPSCPPFPSRRKKEARAAVLSRGAQDYEKQTVKKSAISRDLIYHAIKRNMLFRSCSEEELSELVDVFAPSAFTAGSVVIRQGDDGDLFYIVEEGKLDVMVSTEGGDSQVVGVPYVSGSSFGELALMYGSPRAASIIAKTDCRLWFLDRTAFKGITGSYKQRRDEIILDTIRKVKIGDKVLGDVLRSSEIDAMALATQSDSFGKGDVICRQGEKGECIFWGARWPAVVSLSLLRDRRRLLHGRERHR